MNRTLSLFTKVVAAGLALAACLTLATPADAAYKIGDDDKYLKLGGLFQSWITLDENAAEEWRSDFYLRRMRLMFYGQVTDKVNFFVETDNSNFGKGGNYSVDTFIQDAYLEINLHEMFQLDFGMLLTPFSHHGMQGATSLLALDYHPLIKYPVGSTKVWRDFGLMYRGMFTKWIEVRLGIFSGARGNDSHVETTSDDGVVYNEYDDPRNMKTIPRIVGRLTFNVFEPEGGAGVGGMFYDGLYIKKTDAGIVSTKRVLAIGASFDWQKDQNVILDAVPDTDGATREIDEKSDYVAADVDVFFDLPLGAAKIMSVNGQAGFYYYDFGDRSEANDYYNLSKSGSYSGIGLLSEVGFRYDAYQPVIIFDWFDSKGSDLDGPDGSVEPNEDAGDHLGIYGGFNYYMLGHTTCFKVQFGASKNNGADDFSMGAKIQAQLVF
jgi:Phosphate-selective porin O and P